MVKLIQVILIVMMVISFLGVIAEHDKDLRKTLLIILIACIVGVIASPLLNVLFF